MSQNSHIDRFFNSCMLETQVNQKLQYMPPCGLKGVRKHHETMVASPYIYTYIHHRWPVDPRRVGVNECRPLTENTKTNLVSGMISHPEPVPSKFGCIRPSVLISEMIFFDLLIHNGQTAARVQTQSSETQAREPH